MLKSKYLNGLKKRNVRLVHLFNSYAKNWDMKKKNRRMLWKTVHFMIQQMQNIRKYYIILVFYGRPLLLLFYSFFFAPQFYMCTKSARQFSTVAIAPLICDNVNIYWHRQLNGETGSGGVVISILMANACWMLLCDAEKNTKITTTTTKNQMHCRYN